MESGIGLTKNCVVFEINTEVLYTKPELVHRKVLKKILSLQQSKITSHRPNDNTYQGNRPASVTRIKPFTTTPSPPHGAIHTQGPNDTESDKTETQTGHAALNQGSLQ